MIGDHLLVAPIISENQHYINLRNIEGRWYDFENLNEVNTSSDLYIPI